MSNFFSSSPSKCQIYMINLEITINVQSRSHLDQTTCWWTHPACLLLLVFFMEMRRRIKLFTTESFITQPPVSLIVWSGVWAAVKWVTHGAFLAAAHGRDSVDSHRVIIESIFWGEVDHLKLKKKTIYVGGSKDSLLNVSVDLFFQTNTLQLGFTFLSVIDATSNNKFLLHCHLQLVVDRRTK